MTDETTEQMAVRAVNIVHLLKKEYSIEDRHVIGLYDLLFDIARLHQDNVVEA